MKPNLVIINSEQFGYHIDTYYYCKYLHNRYNITYICWNHNLEKIQIPNVEIVYIERKNGILRGITFLQEVFKYTRDRKTIIFIKHFKIISAGIRLMRSNNPLILDIRTLSIVPSKAKRYLDNSLLKLESKLFKNITVISKSLATKLGLAGTATLLPLGADSISKKRKDFNKFNLLYVGTLYNRNIEKAIEAFALFCKEKKNTIPVKFTIIGEGSGEELELLRATVKRLNLGEKVHILGRIPHNQLQKHFDTHNVGVSYIPMTTYYDLQPATKTFEYLLSGMPVIATATSENKLVINESNGVISDDTVEGFSKGIVLLHNRLSSFNSTTIRHNSSTYRWNKIIDHLAHYIQTISNTK